MMMNLKGKKRVREKRLYNNNMVERRMLIYCEIVLKEDRIRVL